LSEDAADKRVQARWKSFAGCWASAGWSWGLLFWHHVDCQCCPDGDDHAHGQRDGDSGGNVTVGERNSNSYGWSKANQGGRHASLPGLAGGVVDDIELRMKLRIGGHANFRRAAARKLGATVLVPKRNPKTK